MKTRQDQITDVQVPFSGIPRYGSHPFEDLNDDAGRHNDTKIIVEQDVLLGVLDAACRATDLAHGVERPRDGSPFQLQLMAPRLGPSIVSTSPKFSMTLSLAPRK